MRGALSLGTEESDTLGNAGGGCLLGVVATEDGYWYTAYNCYLREAAAAFPRSEVEAPPLEERL